MVGPFPVSTNGNTYILTYLDDFSKYMVCAAMPNGEATTAAKTFFNDMVSRFGVPRLLIRDNGTNFVSQLFEETCKLLGVDRLHTSPYHKTHQSNGSLERSHRPLVEFLRCVVDEGGSNWDLWLCHAMNVH